MSQVATAPPSESPIVVGAVLRLLALPIAGFLGFGIALALGLPRDRVQLLAVTFLLIIAVLSYVAVDRMRPRERRNVLMSIFSLTYLVFFVMPVFVFYLGPSPYEPLASPNANQLTPEAVKWGVIAALVGYLMLVAGNLLPVGGALARFIPQMRREWSYETTLVIALAIIPTGWLVRLISEFGLMPERAGSGALGAISNFTYFGIALLTLCYLHQRSRTALVLMFLLIPPSMVFGFFTGNKSAVLLPAGMVALVHFVVSRRLRAWWIAAFLLVLAFFYPISEVYRAYAWGGGLSTVEVIANPQTAFRIIGRTTASTTIGEHMRQGFQATSHRLNGLGILSTIVRDAGKRVPFQGGWTLAYVPASYVPRLLWPGKPRFMTGQWVTDNFGGGRGVSSSTGPTWIGELYFNFGWAGVVLGMLVLGVWFRFLQEYFLGPNATTPALLAGVIAVAGTGIGVTGDGLVAFNSVGFNVAPVMLLHLLVCFFTPAPRPESRTP
jgi:hypothetical protein